ncbi:hypothetical protein GCM10011390_38200 [Aureimonas endophytica]|uniref:HD Cas3-type domain-containing protein n=1 Tax=Aureimonas endophytica TaxID=2027858 RepID=A0A916ZWW7_9HYPH|nr:hypothetical protein GCM10011390_38200 [Aureimonas endophytica]
MSEGKTVPPFYAHSTERQDKADWEFLPDHLAAVAIFAERFARSFGLAKAACLVGLLHDLGKFDPRFQLRLTDDRIRVDHSTAGAALLMAEAESALTMSSRHKDGVMAQLMASVVAGHHAGLPDHRGADEANLAARVAGYSLVERLDPAWRMVLPLDLTDLFPQGFRLSPQRDFFPFQLALLGRMLFSALVDADRKATERFNVLTGGGPEPDRDWPSLAACLPAFRDGFGAKIAGFGEPEGELAVLRARILAHVRAKAAMPPGLFTLNVPTGGGKTLASLGFALDHAAFHNAAAGAERFRRIITAIPFTSVTEQTAAVFREVLGEDLVLEHHSGFETEEEKPQASSSVEADSRWATKDKMRLAMEDWAAPVVVTTHVQLFESLFASRTSRTRKLHNIANSIVILDGAWVETSASPRRTGSRRSSPSTRGRGSKQ